MKQANLTLIATPLGNLGDLSPRALQALGAASFWIVEDTRVTGRLAQAIGLKAPMTVLNDHTAGGRLESLADRIESEGPACLLTDAGSPGISDPGAALVDLCHERGLVVDAIPGPSAPIVALGLSGFYAQRFAFLGFLPKKPGPAKAALAPFVDSTLTLVLFESPFRFLKTLELCGQTLGNRRCAITRELTKMHQQVWRGRLHELPSEKEVPAKGEFTLVIEGVRRNDDSDPDCV